MKRAPAFSAVLIVLTLAALVLAGQGTSPTAEAHPGGVQAGYDLFETDPAQTWQDLSLPAGFFGTGCDPFVDRVFFEGVPISSFGGFGNLPPTDTIVERLQDAGPPWPPTGVTIDVEIVALSLRSVAPLNVTCPGGSQTWELVAQIPEGDANQQTGTMTIRHDFAEGGTFDSTLPVRPLLTFSRLDAAGQIGPFYFPQPPDAPQLVFQANSAFWCHSGNPLDNPPGHVVIEVQGLTTNFVPGIDCPGPSGGSKQKVLTTEQATLAQHGVKPAEKQPHYKCYAIAGHDPSDVVELTTQFGNQPAVDVGAGSFLCPPALKNGEGNRDPDEPSLECYDILGDDPPHVVNLDDQFGAEPNVDVAQATLLCVPAEKSAASAPLGAIYVCYDIQGATPNVMVDLESQFGLEEDVTVLQAIYLCPPALKGLDGDASAPHLQCYEIVGHDPPDVVDITTQFGFQPTVAVGVAEFFCGPVKKTVKSPPPTPVPPPPKLSQPGDTDGDGCSDEQENGGEPSLGGLRDYLNSWDYYDIDADRNIDLFNDIFGVAGAFGQGPGDPGYSATYDRSPPFDGDIIVGPPNGGIDLFNDIFGVAFQFGHSCKKD